jgi:general stress protein YciG
MLHALARLVLKRATPHGWRRRAPGRWVAPPSVTPSERKLTMENVEFGRGVSQEQSAEGASTEGTPHKLRGFAAMDRTLVSELAKRGGRAAHRAGTAHQFTSDEARVAGRKGGMATHAKRVQRLSDQQAVKS